MTEKTTESNTDIYDAEFGNHWYKKLGSTSNSKTTVCSKILFNFNQDNLKKKDSNSIFEKYSFISQID